MKCIIWCCVLWPIAWLGPLAAVWPLSVAIHPPGHAPWVIWASEWIWRWRWLLVALNLVGTPALGAWCLSRAKGLKSDARARPIRWLPLLALAVLFPVLLLKDQLPPGWTANLSFYLPLLAGSIPLADLARRWTDRGPNRFQARQITWIILAGTGLFWLTGMAYTQRCGEHAGDEGHYIIQAASLYHDRDLDIRNQYEAILGNRLPAIVSAGRLDGYLHVSPASRHGRWYSYHTPGIAFLTVWTVPFGIWARHLVLALIGGLALGGAYLLCRLADARHRPSTLLIALYATSLYGVVYASRFLPEMLGAALTTWLVVAIMFQKRYPARSVLLGAGMVAALPWGHLRFLPLALLGGGFYGLHGLFIPEPWKRKIPRLGAFALLSVLGLGFYRFWQLHFFEGGYSHPVGSLFMSYPAGILRIFTDRGKFADIFPLVVWLVPCGLLGCWTLNRRQRPLLMILGGLFLAQWVIACSARNYGGGATLGGRFLVAVTPLLLPATALYWRKAHGVVRWWLVMLALVSIGYSLLQLTLLSDLGRHFARPIDTMPRILPTLSGWHPLWPEPRFIVGAAITHGLLVLGVHKLNRSIPWLIGALAATLLIGHAQRTGRPSVAPRHHPGQAATQLTRLNLDRAFVQPRDPTAAVRLVEVANVLVDRYGDAHPLHITTAWREAVHDLETHTISQQRIEPNDWAQRDLRWVTLRAPTRIGKGEWLFSLQGVVSGGDVTPVLALREGSQSLLEQVLPVNDQGKVSFQHRFRTQSSRSLLYLLLRLEGDGDMVLSEIALAPVSDAILTQGLSP